MMLIFTALAIAGDVFALFGLYALIVGKLKLSSSLRIEGKRARITGAIFVLAYFLPRIALVLLGGGNVIHALAALPCMAGGIAYALMTRPKSPSSQPEPLPKL